MEGMTTLVIALVIALPVVLFPAAFVWYVNIGGITAALKERRAARKEAVTVETT